MTLAKAGGNEVSAVGVVQWVNRFAHDSSGVSKMRCPSTTYLDISYNRWPYNTYFSVTDNMRIQLDMVQSKIFRCITYLKEHVFIVV